MSTKKPEEELMKKLSDGDDMPAGVREPDEEQEDSDAS